MAQLASVAARSAKAETFVPEPLMGVSALDGDGAQVRITLNRVVTQNEKLVNALYEAREQISSLKEKVDKLEAFADNAGWTNVVRVPLPRSPGQKKSRVVIEGRHILCRSDDRINKDRAIPEEVHWEICLVPVDSPQPRSCE